MVLIIQLLSLAAAAVAAGYTGFHKHLARETSTALRRDCTVDTDCQWTPNAPHKGCNMIEHSDDPSTDLYYQIFENVGTGECDVDNKCNCGIDSPKVCSCLSYSPYYGY
jgi:hypothetical protein